MEYVSAKQLKQVITDRYKKFDQVPKNVYEDAIAKLAKDYGQFDLEEDIIIQIYRVCRECEKALRKQFSEPPPEDANQSSI